MGGGGGGVSGLTCRRGLIADPPPPSWLTRAQRGRRQRSRPTWRWRRVAVWRCQWRARAGRRCVFRWPSKPRWSPCSPARALAASAFPAVPRRCGQRTRRGLGGSGLRTGRGYCTGRAPLGSLDILPRSLHEKMRAGIVRMGQPASLTAVGLRASRMRSQLPIPK